MIDLITDGAGNAGDLAAGVESTRAEGIQINALGIVPGAMQKSTLHALPES